ncbi:metallophosphoesterase [Tamlana crocina]
MQIVHLTDIHLSEKNFKEFENNFRKALINDLSKYHSKNNPIELIVITGDLVDCGGHSLLKMPRFSSTYTNPFNIFDKEFIEPIAAALNIKKTQFLFIPGNHDINENDILWVNEKSMKKDINESNIDKYLHDTRHNFNYKNERLRYFKEFEFEIHKSTPNYKFSNNESTYLHELKNGYKVGFILLNDSWRCSTCELKDDTHNYHYFGVNQIYSGLKNLDSMGSNINICLHHHSVEDFKERIEFERILTTKNIELLLYGHHHSNDSQLHYNGVGGCLGFRGRATLNKPEDSDSKYQSGYKVLDINFGLNKVEKIHYRKYEYDQTKFVADVRYGDDLGIDCNERHGGKGYPFSLQETSPASFLKSLDEDKFKNFK